MASLGLALGSGSDRGFAHIGVLQTLIENRIPVHCIAGSSMGALIGAHYALYQDIHSIIEITKQITTPFLLGLVDFNNPTVSLIKGKKIYDFLTSLFGEATFADTKIPLRMVATVLETGLPYVFEEGKLVEAVMASSTIPGILPPVKVEGLHLIDGGLSAAVPLDILDGMGATARIGVDLYAYSPAPQEHFFAKDVLARTYRIYMSRLSALERYENDERTVILRPETDEGIESLTFTHAAENIEAGRKETLTKISEIKALFC